MSKYIVSAAAIILLVAFFLWGVGQKGVAERSKAQKECAEEKIVEVVKEVEVVKYVYKERAKIQARPNAGRDELLGLMQNGKL